MLSTDRLLEAAAVDIVGFARETDLSISTTGAQTAAIGTALVTGGIFDLLSDVACFIKIVDVGGTASDVTAATGYPLLANTVVPFFVPAGGKIGAITASGSGTLKIHRSK